MLVNVVIQVGENLMLKKWTVLLFLFCFHLTFYLLSLMDIVVEGSPNNIVCGQQLVSSLEEAFYVLNKFTLTLLFLVFL